MLKEFSKNLHELLSGFPKSRPFVCEGNQLDCEVFIVGFNAATEMEASFWSFWSDENGFDKKSWFDAYIRERANKPLIPPKTRRNKLSNTRKVIEWISPVVKPFRCLETNLYFTATESAKDLKKEERRTTVFNYLLKAIKPKILLIHGKKVCQEIEKIHGLTLKTNQINQCQLFDQPIKIFPVAHLSRGWSESKAKEIGKTIKDSLLK